MLRIYTYQKCSTCRKATQWLKTRDIPFEEIAIRETPPPKGELRVVLEAYEGNTRRLFNTSGGDYRAAGLSEKLDDMAVDEALKLLTENGNLVKRPFLIDEEEGLFQVGFKEAEWDKAFADRA